MTLADSSVEHFTRLGSLATELSGYGLAILEHHYHALVFGSFELVVGHTNRRMKIVWDGKDGLVDVFVSGLRNQNSRATWKATRRERADWASVLAVVSKICRESFDAPVA